MRSFLRDVRDIQGLAELTSDVVRAVVHQVGLRESSLPRLYRGITKRSISTVHTKVRQLRALVRFG